MKRRDYPGHDLPRKELHARLFESYQLAARLLMDPLDDPEDVRSEMIVVLLDFLSDPTSADVDRLTLAARAFHSKVVRVTGSTTVENGTNVTGTSWEVKRPA